MDKDRIMVFRYKDLTVAQSKSELVKLYLYNPFYAKLRLTNKQLFTQKIREDIRIFERKIRLRNGIRNFEGITTDGFMFKYEPSTEAAIVGNTVLAAVAHFFKVRYYAKPFDIWKECQDDNRKADSWFAGDFISYDGKLYYGNRWLVFFESAQNDWWLLRNSR